MIVGIGIDVVDIAELAESVGDRPRMRARVFTRRELEYCRERPWPAQHLAARFAAKEAAFKAVGTGWAHGVRWRDAEVVAEAGRPPTLVLRGTLLRRARKLGMVSSAVSLTHSGAYAAALVVLEGRT